jgi:hypothetical protein
MYSHAIPKIDFRWPQLRRLRPATATMHLDASNARRISPPTNRTQQPHYYEGTIPLLHTRGEMHKLYMHGGTQGEVGWPVSPGSLFLWGAYSGSPIVVVTLAVGDNESDLLLRACCAGTHDDQRRQLDVEVHRRGGGASEAASVLRTETRYYVQSRQSGSRKQPC